MSAAAHPFGIRTRLFLAFGAVAAMTVAATVVAWIAFGRLSRGLDAVVSDNLPAVSLAARLAEHGALLAAGAPRLAAAASEAERAAAWERLARGLEAMGELQRRLGGAPIGAADRRALGELIDALAANLRALDTNVRRRIWFRDHSEELGERLRWAHADFLDEIEPMIDDARFNIELVLERAAEDGGEPGATLRRELARQQALLRASATGNLAVGLIAGAATLPGREAIEDSARYLREVLARLEGDVEVLRPLPEALSLRQAVSDIRAFADGESSLLELRRDELATLAEGSRLVDANRALIARLQERIGARIERGNARTAQAAAAARAATRRGKLLLLGAAAASLAVAVLVVWLYVGRSLVRRITRLDRSMRAIAAGDLDAPVPTGGDDEISAMARALRTFRDTLSETQAELVQAGKLAALGQLAAGVAHELNQPLAAIRSYAHNARRLIEHERPAEAAATLERISALTGRMGETIGRLRTLARRPAADLGPVDLARVTGDALALLEARIRAEGVRVRTDIPEPARRVRAEPIRLEQVLLNLLGNALDAVATSERREVAVSAAAADGQVRLAVSDSGCGIPPGAIEHVFDPFFTTKEVGEGLGLGLSISYNIVKDFGGSMRVASEPGRGTTFTVVLERASEGGRE